MTSKLNDVAFQQSRQYAADYNEVVRRYQSQMDERLIGHWVNTTGVALNSTLNEFYDDVENSKSCIITPQSNRCHFPLRMQRAGPQTVESVDPPVSVDTELTHQSLTRYLATPSFPAP